jgi:hypothetical protein
MEEDTVPKKDLHSRTGRADTKRKTQERMERRNRKRSPSAGSEKMERVGDSEKWRGIVRQAKAHSGLQRQRKKKKKKKKKETKEEEKKKKRAKAIMRQETACRIRTISNLCLLLVLTALTQQSIYCRSFVLHKCQMY